MRRDRGRGAFLAGQRDEYRVAGTMVARRYASPEGDDREVLWILRTWGRVDDAMLAAMDVDLHASDERSAIARSATPPPDAETALQWYALERECTERASRLEERGWTRAASRGGRVHPSRTGANWPAFRRELWAPGFGSGSFLLEAFARFVDAPLQRAVMSAAPVPGLLERHATAYHPGTHATAPRAREEPWVSETGRRLLLEAQEIAASQKMPHAECLRLLLGPPE
jgi:hypothetical protein